MRSKAFVTINREWTNSDEWLAEPFDKVRAWIDLFCLANYKDTESCQRGELITSERTLAKRWHWEKGQVRRFLQQLEQSGRIERTSKRTSNRTSEGTTVRIVKYNDYQPSPTSKTTSEQTSKRTVKNKYIKNINNLSNMPDGIKQEIIERFGTRAEALIEDVRRYYEKNTDKEFPGWTEAVEQFAANQDRWGRRPTAPRQDSTDRAFAAFLAEIGERQ